VAAAAVLTVEVSRHENAGTAVLVGTLTPQARDLAILVNLVVLENGKLDLLSLVLDLLGGGEGLLLTLLATTSQAEDEMEGRLLLDVVIGQSTTILELLAREDQTLLVGRDAFLVLDLGFHILDGIAWLDLEGDGLPRESLDEDLHSSSQPQDEMKSGLLLDVVVGQSATVFELFSGEDETLLVGRDAFFVLDLGLDVFDAVGWFDFEGNRLPRQGLYEDLHVEMWAIINGNEV